MADILIIILSSEFKLALLVSFKVNIHLIFELKSEVSRANLNANKCQPFLHKVYGVVNERCNLATCKVAPHSAFFFGGIIQLH